MDYIVRELSKIIFEKLQPNKVVIVFGARRVGKTMLVKEIDWVEERGGLLYGYDFKWKEAQVKVPSQWKTAYPEASFEVINSENFETWLA